MAPQTLPSPSLYISDLDGTLLNAEGVLSPWSEQTIREVLSGGGLFTLASARSLTTMRERLGSLPLSLPVISMNGAAITSYSGDKEYRITALPEEEVSQLVALFKEIDIAYLASGKILSSGKAFCTIPTHSGRTPPLEDFLIGRRRQQDPRIIEESFAEVFTQRKTISFTVVDTVEKSEVLLSALKEKNLDASLSIYPMGKKAFGEKEYTWITLQSSLATKGEAALYVCEMANVSPKQLVVFGDQSNDEPLFEAARRHGGEALFIENGLPSLQATATKTIGPNDTDSVMRYVLEKENHAHRTQN